MRRAAAAAVLFLLASAAAAQDPSIPSGEHQRATEWFFGPAVALLLVFAVGVTMALAIKRARSRGSSLPVWDDETFEEEVLGSRIPVLVHFAESWNITNRAALAQTEVLAYLNRGAVKVGLLEVGECPKVMERFPEFVAPAYLLFYQGRKLLHRPGLWQAEDLQQQIDRALSREGF